MTPEHEHDLSFALGELTGKVDAIVTNLASLERSITDLRESNSSDHGHVMALLSSKAETARVNSHAERIDSLEATRDKDDGRTDGATLVVRAIYASAVLGIAALAYLSGSGAL